MTELQKMKVFAMHVHDYGADGLYIIAAKSEKRAAAMLLAELMCVADKVEALPVSYEGSERILTQMLSVRGGD